MHLKKSSSPNPVYPLIGLKTIIYSTQSTHIVFVAAAWFSLFLNGTELHYRPKPIKYTKQPYSYTWVATAFTAFEQHIFSKVTPIVGFLSLYG